MAGNHYLYTELDKSRKEIRLLRLINAPDGTIACELETFDLDDMQDVSYRALSYVWGPRHPTFDILVDGKPLTIRENLYRFLEVAAGDDDLLGVYFWIDQICIDQTAISERNHQVSFMADIYRQAEEVIIWLGSGDSQSETTMKYLSNSIKGSTSKYPVLAPEIKHLVANPYWKRLWITQEFILSRAMCIMWGNRKLPGEIWTRFWDEFDFDFGEQVQDWLDLRLQLQILRNLNTFRGLPIFRGIGEPATIVWFTSYQECEDPKDYLFGIQSLIPASERVTIDYGRSAEHVFLSIVRLLSRQRPTNGDGNRDLKDDVILAVGSACQLAKRMLPHLLGSHPLGLQPFLCGCDEECPKRRRTLDAWGQAIQDGTGDDFLVEQVMNVLQSLKRMLQGMRQTHCCC
jgi:hypothetical protein